MIVGAVGALIVTSTDDPFFAVMMFVDPIPAELISSAYDDLGIGTNGVGSKPARFDNGVVGLVGGLEAEDVDGGCCAGGVVMGKKTVEPLTAPVEIEEGGVCCGVVGKVEPEVKPEDEGMGDDPEVFVGCVVGGEEGATVSRPA